MLRIARVPIGGWEVRGLELFILFYVEAPVPRAPIKVEETLEG